MGRCDFRVCEARNLPDVETFGKPDPFVKLTINTKTFTTSACRTTLNPRWDEVFKIYTEHPDCDSVLLEVWNKNPIKDDFLGQVTVGLGDLEKGEIDEKWWKLENDQDTGDLKLRIMAVDFGKSSPGLVHQGSNDSGAFRDRALSTSMDLQRSATGDGVPVQQHSNPSSPTADDYHHRQRAATLPVQQHQQQHHYPPQQHGYPPMQQQYPPPPHQYPPMQQHGGYPPPPHGYPPQQPGGYPNAQYPPPPQQQRQQYQQYPPPTNSPQFNYPGPVTYAPNPHATNTVGGVQFYSQPQQQYPPPPHQQQQQQYPRGGYGGGSSSTAQGIPPQLY